MVVEPMDDLELQHWEALREAAKSSLAQWVEVCDELQRAHWKHPSGKSHWKLDVHHGALTPHVVEQETDVATLKYARNKLRSYQQKHLPRGTRADHPTTKAIVLINNRLNALQGHCR